jgi:hypothetical protein
MAMMTARIDVDALAVFDALAEARGGRGALLRQMIDQFAADHADTPLVAKDDAIQSHRVSLTFTDTECAVIAYRAAQRSTNRSAWIKALVRRHLSLKSRVDDGLLAELAPIRMQLLRIGRNLNQAMKVANLKMMEDGDRKAGRELKRIADMRLEIAEQIAAVGEAMRGDVAFWNVAD